MLQWFVVIAKQNQEAIATRGLHEQGFDIYLPLKFDRERVAHAMKPVASLRMAPYFFVRFDAQRGEGGAVKNTRGIENLPCDPMGNPRVFRKGDKIIAQLKANQDAEYFGAAPKIGRTDLRLGEKVEIDNKAHPMNGCYGSLAGIEHGIATIISDNGIGIECGESDLRSLEPKKEIAAKKPKAKKVAK